MLRFGSTITWSALPVIVLHREGVPKLVPDGEILNIPSQEYLA
jgi:hypothetical protein